MIKKCIKEDAAIKFGEFIKNNTNYIFLYKSIKGIFYGVDPWFEENKVKNILKSVSNKDCLLVKFFLFSESVKKEDLLLIITRDNYEFLISSGYAYEEGDCIVPDNYVIIPIENKLFVVNPPFEKFRNGKKVPDLYVGADSLKLINFFKGEKKKNMLDLCSGSGIIGISLSDYVENIDFVEIREDVIDALNFNLLINNISKKRVRIIKSDLFDELDNKRYDYIVTNPPFVPTPSEAFLPVCGDGGSDGLDIVRRIVKDINRYLSADGRLYMVLEAIGNEKRPFVIDLFEECFFNGILNVSLINRQVIEEQAKFSAMISHAMSDDRKDINELYRLWMNIFDELGATYIYPTLIEYVMSDVDLEVNVFRNNLSLDRTTRYKTKEGVEVRQIEKTINKVVTKSNSYIIDDEMYQFLGNGEIKLLDDFVKQDSSKYFLYIDSIRYLNEKGIIDII